MPTITRIATQMPFILADSVEAVVTEQKQILKSRFASVMRDMYSAHIMVTAKKVSSSLSNVFVCETHCCVHVGVSS